MAKIETPFEYRATVYILISGELAKIALTDPICTEVGEKIALSRRIEKHWRLIGWGTIRRGVTIKPTMPDE